MSVQTTNMKTRALRTRRRLQKMIDLLPAEHRGPVRGAIDVLDEIVRRLERNRKGKPMRTIYRITGVNFRPDEDKAALRMATIGAPVLLEREPSNQFDANAIRVWLAGRHVGYVPAAMARNGLTAYIDEHGAEPVGEQTGRTLPGILTVDGNQLAVQIEEKAS